MCWKTIGDKCFLEAPRGQKGDPPKHLQFGEPELPDAPFTQNWEVWFLSRKKGRKERKKKKKGCSYQKPGSVGAVAQVYSEPSDLTEFY